jgi:hypothetical protein
MPIHLCDVELRDMVDQLYGTPDNEAEYSTFVRNTIWPFVFNETAAGRTIKENYAHTEAFEACFKKEFTRRFGVQSEIKGGTNYPGVLFAYRIEEIFQDFLSAKIPEMESLKEAEAPVAHVKTADERFAFLCDEVRADIGDVFRGNPGLSSLEIEKKKNASGEYRKAFDFVMQSSVAQGYGKTLAPAAKPAVPAEISKFAHLLSEEILTRGVPRPAAGYVTLLGKYKYELSEFNRLSNAAAEANLI